MYFYTLNCINIFNPYMSINSFAVSWDFVITLSGKGNARKGHQKQVARHHGVVQRRPGFGCKDWQAGDVSIASCV